MYKILVYSILILMVPSLFVQNKSGVNKNSYRRNHCLEPDSLFNKNLNKESLNRMLVFLPDSSISFTSNIRNDHRFFGYSMPDTTSERLILFSVFTSDVENNPYCCKLGAYYDLFGEYPRLKLRNKINKFIEVELTDSSENSQMVYFKERWINIK